MLLSNLDVLATAPCGVARLRELILTLAVQGKLVPQDSADEPASVLLRKIRAERDRLIAEGKIKRDKPLAEIAGEEILFELPQAWEWVRLGDLCSYIQRGKGPAYADHSQHRVVSQKCVRWYGLDLAPARFVTKESLARYEAIRFLRAGDLLWNSTGTGTIGRACLIPLVNDKDGLVADSHVTVVRPLQLDSRFLWRWIQSSYVQNEIEGSASGTTNQIELNTSTVINHLVPLPPLAEQFRIVTRVEELMRLCDALEAKGQLEATQHDQLVSKLLGTLTASTTPEDLADHWQRVAQHFDLLLDRPEAMDALEQTLLQLAVRGLLVPQDPADEPASVLLQKVRTEKDRLIAAGQIKRDKPLPPITDEEKPFELPVGWEWVRLDAISEFTNGFAFPSNQFFSDSTGVGIVKIGDIQDGLVTANGMSYVSQEYAKTIDKVFRVMPGDMLIAMSGATTGKLGFNFTDSHFFLNQRVGKIALHFIDQQYAYSYLRTKVADNLAISAGSAIPNLSTAQIKEIIFPLPPLAEQSRIVTRVTDLRRLCVALRQRLKSAKITQSNLARALVESSKAL